MRKTIDVQKYLNTFCLRCLFDCSIITEDEAVVIKRCINEKKFQEKVGT